MSRPHDGHPSHLLIPASNSGEPRWEAIRCCAVHELCEHTGLRARGQERVVATAGAFARRGKTHGIRRPAQ